VSGTAAVAGVANRRGASDLAWMISGNLCQALSQWGYLVAATKLAGVEGAGRYAYANAICTQTVLLTGLHLRSLHGSDTQMEFPFAAYFTLRATTAAISAALMGAAAWLHNANTELSLLVAFVGLTRVLESLIESGYGQMQRARRINAVGRSLLLRGAASLVAFWLVLERTGSLPLAALGTAAMAATLMAVHDFPLLRGERFLTSDWTQVGRLFRQARSLGFTAFLSALQVNLPRYLIKGALGDAALGIYAALAQLPLSAAIFVRSMGEAALPRFARWYQVEKRPGHPPLVYRMLAAVVLLFAGGGVLALVAGERILSILYAPAHAAHAALLLLLIAAELPSQMMSVLGCAATASRRLRLQPAAMCVALLFLAAAALPAIEWRGMWGLALAVGLANALMLGGYILLLRREADA
jgi:O-antigen/teichoic acid export membrane protein